MQGTNLNLMHDMNIVVTGAEGFIGQNLCMMLSEQGYHHLIQAGKNTTRDELIDYLKTADFIFHLAGVNRPQHESEFEQGNAELTQFIVDTLVSLEKKTPMMLSSSTQAEHANPYGLSKLRAEQFVHQYAASTSAATYIYRLPNVFGKWCKPNYNSFVATFCHNIANDLPISINDPSASVTLVYIDDVCQSLIDLLKGKTSPGWCQVQPEYSTTVGDVAALLNRFKDSRQTLVTENVGQGLTRALYSTYLSYFRPQQFCYSIPSYTDERGAFCEMLKTPSAGQFSFFSAHPGITRGGHYHHTKNEKFLVIKGKALFKFEHMISGECYALEASGSAPMIVETVPGWSHDITNIGDDELLVMLWANEVFDRSAPDTFAHPL